MAIRLQGYREQFNISREQIAYDTRIPLSDIRAVEEGKSVDQRTVNAIFAVIERLTRRPLDTVMRDQLLEDDATTSMQKAAYRMGHEEGLKVRSASGAVLFMSSKTGAKATDNEIHLQRSNSRHW